MTTMTDPNDPDNTPIDQPDEDGEYLGYPDDYEMGAQGRMDDYEPQPDSYLDAAYEDRYDMGDGYEF